MFIEREKKTIQPNKCFENSLEKERLTRIKCNAVIDDWTSLDLTLLRAFVSAPCCNSSKTHEAWPPAAASISGVVESYEKCIEKTFMRNLVEKCVLSGSKFAVCNVECSHAKIVETGGSVAIRMTFIQPILLNLIHIGSHEQPFLYRFLFRMFFFSSMACKGMFDLHDAIYFSLILCIYMHDRSTIDIIMQWFVFGSNFKHDNIKGNYLFWKAIRWKESACNDEKMLDNHRHSPLATIVL